MEKEVEKGSQNQAATLLFVSSCTMPSKINAVKFKYVLADTWFASVENMQFIKLKLDKHFIMPLKNNRKIALSEDDQKIGKFFKIKELDLEKGIRVWLDDLPFAVRLVKGVFKNEDESSGTLYLVTSNLELTNEQVSAIYKKRLKVETYHKSLKSNASLAKSPTKTPSNSGKSFVCINLWIHQAWRCFNSNYALELNVLFPTTIPFHTRGSFYNYLIQNQCLYDQKIV